MFTVAVILADQAYGGPEEGGWWYRYSIPEESLIEHLRGFISQEDAQIYAERLYETVCVPLNEGRHKIDSVLSEGVYDVEIYEDSYPRFLPDRIPRYE